MLQQGQSLSFLSANNVSLTTTGDKLVFGPAVPVLIERWGFIVTTALNLTSMVLALDKTPTLLGAGGRVDAWGGTITRTTALAAGLGLYNDMPALPTASRIILPGEGVVIECTDAADTAGVVLLFIEYRPLTFSQPELVKSGKMTLVTA